MRAVCWTHVVGEHVEKLVRVPMPTPRLKVGSARDAVFHVEREAAWMSAACSPHRVEEVAAKVSFNAPARDSSWPFAMQCAVFHVEREATRRRARCHPHLAC